MENRQKILLVEDSETQALKLRLVLETAREVWGSA